MLGGDLTRSSKRSRNPKLNRGKFPTACNWKLSLNQLLPSRSCNQFFGRISLNLPMNAVYGILPLKSFLDEILCHWKRLEYPYEQGTKWRLKTGISSPPKHIKEPYSGSPIHYLFLRLPKPCHGSPEVLSKSHTLGALLLGIGYGMYTRNLIPGSVCQKGRKPDNCIGLATGMNQSSKGIISLFFFQDALNLSSVPSPISH